MSAGVLNQEQTNNQVIHSNPSCFKFTGDVKEKPDPSAIDLPIGDVYYEVPASCRPSERHDVTDVLNLYGPNHSNAKTIDSVKGVVLQPHKVYLVPLQWKRIELPKVISARCTARSSIGRLDVLVRLVADKQPHFDRLQLGAKAALYVEIVPLTFPILIKPGLSLSQMRFTRGQERHCTIPLDSLKYESQFLLSRQDGTTLETILESSDDDGVLLTLDLSDDAKLGFPGFVAKAENNLDPVDLSQKEMANPKEYWDEVPSAKNGTITLEREKFYIFRSKERFVLPPHLAVECLAYSESLGDIRIHYAGFAHPYFGYEYIDGKWIPRDGGTPLIFEVRGFSMDTILRDGTPLAKVYFRRMSESAGAPDPPPDKRGGDASDKTKYNSQELQLSAYFADWK